MSLNHKFSIRTGLMMFIAIFVFQVSAFSKCVYKNTPSIKVQGVGNMLKWSTAEEQNMAFFVIQKSTDGIDFSKIGDVKGAGFSKKINHYRFLDFCLPEGSAYYRLLHYAPDGSFTISATFYLENSPQTDVKILAANTTITNKSLGLMLVSKRATNVKYEVKDTRGQVVYSGSHNLKVGNNALSIDCDAFKNGKYDVVLKTATESDRITIHKVDLDKVPNIEFVVLD